MISRRYRIQDRRSTRKGALLLFLSIGLLLFLIFGGIPLLVQFSAFVGTLKSSSAPIAQEDKTPPVPPGFEPALPQYTQSEVLTVTGRAEAGSTVRIYKNEAKFKEILIDDSSKFSLEMPIDKGENIIWATATDVAGNESAPSTRFKVVYGKEPPKLTITKPTDGETFYGQDKAIAVEGNVEGKENIDVRVTVNDRLAIVGSDGMFSVQITLSEGENTLTVIAEDSAGNKTEKTLTVSYTL
ncbi:MAG: hypothetical protein HYS83_00235 [Candidatus Blackburnbacteria bacterium]|nr:hypothetical protein [Candidatus Blackburnbacteria bacterium]